MDKIEKVLTSFMIAVDEKEMLEKLAEWSRMSLTAYVRNMIITEYKKQIKKREV